MPAEKIISELITEYGDSILRMCYVYLKDYHLAEDVTQETFIQVYNNYESFQQQSSIKTWLFGLQSTCVKIR